MNNDFNKQNKEFRNFIEQFLYEVNDIISDDLFECENLEELINYNLIIQDNMKELKKQIKQIFKNNKIEVNLKNLLFILLLLKMNLS